MVPETSKTIHSGSLLRHPSRSDPGPSSTNRIKIYVMNIKTQSNRDWETSRKALHIEDFVNPMPRIQLCKLSIIQVGNAK